MRYKVIVAVRNREDLPWDFTEPPVAQFIDSERAIRFAKSEVRSGWDKERVRVVAGRKTIWPRGT